MGIKEPINCLVVESRPMAFRLVVRRRGMVEFLLFRGRQVLAGGG
jgi:hypothetical protein